MKIRSVIFGLRSKKLLPEEKEFLELYNPLGVILFSRNIDNPSQVNQLILEIRRALSRENAPIFIDQEGGRVSRLKEPYWFKPPTAEIFGKIAEENLDDAKQAVYLNAQIIGLDMAKIGINIDCAPVLDVPVSGAHSVIGDRAFSHDKHIVVELAQRFADGLRSTGVVPIMKHIPGHGRGFVDSHMELPVVQTDYKELKHNDFFPFKQIKKVDWAMTAHILYNSIDPENPATTSKKVIDVIRSEIGFKGLLVSDCITMQALNGTMPQRAKQSFTAGIDIVIHSHGSLDEQKSVAAVAPYMTENQLDILLRSYETAEPHYHVKNKTNLQNELFSLLGKYNMAKEANHIPDPTEFIPPK